MQSREERREREGERGGERGQGERGHAKQDERTGPCARSCPSCWLHSELLPPRKGVFYRKESSVVLAPMDHSIWRGWTPIGVGRRLVGHRAQTDARNGSMGFDTTLEGRTPPVSAASDPDSAGRAAAQVG
jgi:hypothetical protein